MLFVGRVFVDRVLLLGGAKGCWWELLLGLWDTCRCVEFGVTLLDWASSMGSKTPLDGVLWGARGYVLCVRRGMRCRMLHGAVWYLGRWRHVSLRCTGAIDDDVAVLSGGDVRWCCWSRVVAVSVAGHDAVGSVSVLGTESQRFEPFCPDGVI